MNERGNSPVVGTIALVAVVIVAGAAVGAVTLSSVGDQTAPPSAVITVEEVKLTPDQISIEDEDDPGGCADSYDGEIGFRVTLDRVERADKIEVLVTGETGKRRKLLWDSPSEADEGTQRLLANEVTTGPVDVDIGKDGSNDFATCPGESLTLEFYATVDGDTYLLRRYDFG